MKRIKTIETRDLKKSVKNGGCGECQTSCQSACKTSCGVANQQCEKCIEKYFSHIKENQPLSRRANGFPYVTEC